MYNLKDRRPRILECRHTFCERCLQGLVDRRIILNQKWEKEEAQRRKEWEIEMAETIAKAQREIEYQEMRAAKAGVRSGASKKKVEMPVFPAAENVNESAIECPTCQGCTHVPNLRRGVSSLNANAFVNDLLMNGKRETGPQKKEAFVACKACPSLPRTAATHRCCKCQPVGTFDFCEKHIESHNEVYLTRL